MDMILILEDDYIADRKKYLSEGYEALHQKLGIYEACLDDIVENGIASGEVSKALEEFAKQVKVQNVKYTKSSSRAIGAKYSTYCNSFLEKIIKEGKELY